MIWRDCASVFQYLKVDQLLLPADCSLISDQRVFADDEHRNTVELCYCEFTYRFIHDDN